MRYSLCDGWEFTPQWSDEFPTGGGEARAVRLPHTCKELPDRKSTRLNSSHWS